MAIFHLLFIGEMVSSTIIYATQFFLTTCNIVTVRTMRTIMSVITMMTMTLREHPDGRIILEIYEIYDIDHISDKGWLQNVKLRPLVKN